MGVVRKVQYAGVGLAFLAGGYLFMRSMTEGVNLELSTQRIVSRSADTYDWLDSAAIPSMIFGAATAGVATRRLRFNSLCNKMNERYKVSRERY